MASVRKWRGRWEKAPRLETLLDGDRSGRPPVIPLEARCKVVQLACDTPDKLWAPFRDVWTQQALADAVRSMTGHSISRSTVQRILSTEDLRPHRVRPWLHSPDPDFEAKVARICDIYRNSPEDVTVLCVDEKPMQALERKYPTVVGPDGVVHREYEYIRHGTACLLGAFDIRTGETFGEVVPKRTSEATVAFMERLASEHPTGEVRGVGQPQHPPRRASAPVDGVQPPPRGPLPLRLHAEARLVDEPDRGVVLHPAASSAPLRQFRDDRLP